MESISRPWRHASPAVTTITHHTHGHLPVSVIIIVVLAVIALGLATRWRR